MINIKKSAGGQSGFTLVEVMIATVILTVGLLGVAFFFSRGMLILAGTPTQLAAKELAEELVDHYTLLRDTGDTSWRVAGRSSEICSANERPDDCRLTRHGRNFRAETNIFNDGDWRVEITVFYMSPNGNERSYTLRTIIN